MWMGARQVIAVGHSLFASISFIAEQNHRINGEGPSSRDQGRDDAYAQHRKIDIAEQHGEQHGDGWDVRP